MSSTVELIVGPARSGKAGVVVEAYLEALGRRGDPGSCLMLVPTALRRRATESRLLAAQKSGVLIRPQVVTIHELADRLLTAAGRPVRRIGDLARRQVIRQCLARLSDKDAAVLGPVRDTPGLVDALDALFRELKAARVEPETFGSALAGRLRTPRNRLLVILYENYQKALQASEVYDDAGQFWHAAAVVADGRFGPFGDLAVLAVDGFQEFAPAQLDMIEALSARAAKTLVTLTYHPDRPNLFGVTARTRERLRARFGKRLKEILTDAPTDLPPDLQRVRTNLFAMPDGKPRPRASGEISIFRAAGCTREVEEIARRIADLVRGGATRPSSIAVLVRSHEAYAALIRQVFPRYGFPFRVETGRALDDCPIVRAAMSLVRLQTENYSFRALARLTKSNYFSPAAFGAEADTVRRAVRFAREANVWGGRGRYAEGFEYLRGLARRSAEVTDDAGEPALAPEQRAERIASIDHAARFIDRLFTDLALPEKATRRTLADRLRQVIRAAGLWSAATAGSTPETRAADLKALLALENTLDEVALLDESDASEVPLGTFLAEVEQGLSLESVAAEGPDDAPVIVLDVRQCRALSFDHVFLLGLAEKEFPRRGRRHPFFDDAERQDLRERSVDLADAGHDAEQEMLLAYLAMTRARAALTLSYPSLDSQGRPALASHYVEELQGLFDAEKGADAIAVAEIGSRDLELPPERARSERELLAAAMFELWGPGPTERGDEHLAVLDALLARGHAAETALAGLAIEWEREHGEAFGPFDGILSAPDIVEELCRRYPGGGPLSASRLEAFGCCPFTFFARDILGLEPLEEPSPDLEPMELGLIYHSLLQRFFANLAESKEFGGRLAPESRDAATLLLERTAQDYFKHLESCGRVGSPALWKIQKQGILRDLVALVAWHAENLAGWRAAYTEVPFGARPGVTLKPPGRREPIALAGPHGAVLIRGRIDRIDLAVEGDPGFQVVDYKTGGAPSHPQMRDGTSFQLQVYLWAARAILGDAGEGSRALAFFLPIRHPNRAGLIADEPVGRKRRMEVDEALALAGKYVHRFVDAMRRGQFPVWPRGDCSNYCAFKEICRYAEWRMQRKWDLHPIAGLEVIAPESADGEEAGS